MKTLYKSAYLLPFAATSSPTELEFKMLECYIGRPGGCTILHSFGPVGLLCFFVFLQIDNLHAIVTSLATHSTHSLYGAI